MSNKQTVPGSAGKILRDIVPPSTPQGSFLHESEISICKTRDEQLFS
jgi:hypothetical protein